MEFEGGEEPKKAQEAGAASLEMVKEGGELQHFDKEEKEEFTHAMEEAIEVLKEKTASKAEEGTSPKATVNHQDLFLDAFDADDDDEEQEEEADRVATVVKVEDEEEEPVKTAQAEEEGEEAVVERKDDEKAVVVKEEEEEEEAEKSATQDDVEEEEVTGDSAEGHVEDEAVEEEVVAVKKEEGEAAQEADEEVVKPEEEAEVASAEDVVEIEAEPEVKEQEPELTPEDYRRFAFVSLCFALYMPFYVITKSPVWSPSTISWIVFLGGSLGALTVYFADKGNLLEIPEIVEEKPAVPQQPQQSEEVALPTPSETPAAAIEPVEAEIGSADTGSFESEVVEGSDTTTTAAAAAAPPTAAAAPPIAAAAEPPTEPSEPVDKPTAAATTTRPSLSIDVPSPSKDKAAMVDEDQPKTMTPTPEHKRKEQQQRKEDAFPAGSTTAGSRSIGPPKTVPIAAPQPVKAAAAPSRPVATASASSSARQQVAKPVTVRQTEGPAYGEKDSRSARVEAVGHTQAQKSSSNVSPSSGKPHKSKFLSPRSLSNFRFPWGKNNNKAGSTPKS